MSTEYFIQHLHNIPQYAFFSAAHGTLSKTDHILAQKQASASTRK
jgi:hypothetical protein